MPRYLLLKRKIAPLLALGMFCTLSGLCPASTLSGRVVAIADGDTITVLDAANTQHKIRLAGIDAPEKKQDFGARSKQSLSRMVYDKQVLVDWSKKDRYGRIIGKVFVAQEGCLKESCAKNLDSGLAQVAFGLAWHYKKYEREQPIEDRQTYAQTQVRAMTNKIGLWSKPNPVPPWEFRRDK